MFEQFFNRKYDMIEFPYFVPEQELDNNIEYARQMIEEEWIPMIWNMKIKRAKNRNARHSNEIKRILSHGGNILEICAGSGGGYMPEILSENYNAHIMISDLCPTVVREWKKFFDGIDNPPPNVEFAAFNVCDMPFKDNCIDIITGEAAIGNVEGDKRKALSEVYRVLKPNGLFIMEDGSVIKEDYDLMESYLKKEFMTHYPAIFSDYQKELEELGFSVETIIKEKWSNKDDNSPLADFTRNLKTELIFSMFTKICVK